MYIQIRELEKNISKIIQKAPILYRRNLSRLLQELTDNHAIQWDFEDLVLSSVDIEEAINAAKQSRAYNIKRAFIKKHIDTFLSSKYREVKVYADKKDL
jgi:hypothetical protein